MMDFGPDYPELLVELAAHLQECLIENGMPNQQATELALKATERVRLNFGGQVIYIPFGAAHEVLKRWEEIWEEFTGDNQPQLARKHQCSEVHINRILRKMRAAKLRSVQREIPFPVAEKPQP
jgi:Mor family transcriptional regulator